MELPQDGREKRCLEIALFSANGSFKILVLAFLNLDFQEGIEKCQLSPSRHI